MLSDDLGTYAKTKLIVQLRVEPQLNDSKKYYVDTEGASVEYSTLAQAKKAINKILRGA
jgi:septal ring-binding cell division protein DamX